MRVETQIFGVPRLDWYTRKKVIILVNPKVKEGCSHYNRRCPVQVNNVFTYKNNYLICELWAFTPNIDLLEPKRRCKHNLLPDGRMDAQGMHMLRGEWAG